MPSLTSFLSAKGRGGVALGLFVTVVAFGCFKDPKPNLTEARTCKSVKECPHGLICGPGGLCCASSDGTSCTRVDASVSGDGAASPDSLDDASRLETKGEGDVSRGRPEVGPDGGPLDTGNDAPFTGGGGEGGGGGGETGRTGTGGIVGTGGIETSGGTTSGGAIAVGGSLPIGGTQDTGGKATTSVAGSGGGGTGGGATGGGGAGGTTVTCTGNQKPCKDGCISASECCETCSGNKPICSGGTCVGNPNGTACTAATAAACASGLCVDGVCCDLACTGNCESCIEDNLKGTCSPSKTARVNCLSDGSVCGGSCDGTEAHRKECTYPSNTIQCAAGSCNSSTNAVTDPRKCDGQGNCGAVEPRSCAPFTCKDNTSCASNCPVGQDPCGGTTCVSLSTDTHCGTCSNDCTVNTINKKCMGTSCVQCLGDPQCTGTSTPVCNTSTHTCAVCLQGSNAGCPSGMVCTGSACVQCLTSPDCAGRPDGKSVCLNNQCVQCTSSNTSNCTGNTPDCNTSTNTCVQCTGPTSCKTYWPTTPACYGNTCVECNTSPECTENPSYGPGATCDTTPHTCKCRAPSANNLLVNPGFEASMSDWASGSIDLCPASSCPPLETWEQGPSSDADGCVKSGAMHLTLYWGFMGTVVQCVRVTPGTAYMIGLKYKQQSSDAGAVQCLLDYYTGNTAGKKCSGDLISPSDPPLLSGASATTTWGTMGPLQTNAPSTAHSVLIKCGLNSSADAWIDQIYFDTLVSGGRY